MTMLRRFLLIAVSSCMLLPSLAKGDVAGVNETHMGFPGGKCHLYRLLLTDKHGTPYSLSHPEDYLSGKAIQRRNKQGLATDSTDLPHTPAYLRRISAVDGVKIVSKSKWNNTVVVRLVNDNSLKTLTALPFVKEAIKVFTSPDTIKASARLIVQNDLALRGNPDNHYGVAKENINMVNGRSLHEMGYKGRGITIAIFDGGFMNADRIPAFRNVNIKGAHDFVAFGTDDIFKESEHGTKVLSTMATNLPGKFVGTAPKQIFGSSVPKTRIQKVLPRKTIGLPRQSMPTPSGSTSSAVRWAFRISMTSLPATRMQNSMETMPSFHVRHRCWPTKVSFM